MAASVQFSTCPLCCPALGAVRTVPLPCVVPSNLMEALKRFPQELYLIQVVMETLATLTESGKLLPLY